MGLKYVFFSILCWSYACNSPASKIEYSIDNDTFIKVMTDLYFAEQVVKNHTYQKDSVRTLLKNQIMEIHEIKDTAQFFIEMNQLMQDTDKYQMISDSIVKRFERLEEENK